MREWSWEGCVGDTARGLGVDVERCPECIPRRRGQRGRKRAVTRRAAPTRRASVQRSMRFWRATRSVERVGVPARVAGNLRRGLTSARRIEMAENMIEEPHEQLSPRRAAVERLDGTGFMVNSRMQASHVLLAERLARTFRAKQKEGARPSSSDSPPRRPLPPPRSTLRPTCQWIGTPRARIRGRVPPRRPDSLGTGAIEGPGRSVLRG
jgi:hypothetical protein